MNCRLAYLKEQKYMGIQTKVLFAAHDETDFRQLQIDVLRSGVRNIDECERFLALDSDFSEQGFHYTPLVPVTSFEDVGYYQFIRAAGEYYCFAVSLKELGPDWFSKCFAYMEQNGLKIDHSFDLEYYPQGYMPELLSGSSPSEDQMIEIIFRRAD